MTHPDPEQSQPVPLADVAPLPGSDRMVDGVRVRTYRGKSLSELAPRIRAELGDSAMILRQREGVTGGIAGFFARRTVEVDVAVIDVPGTGRVDVSDGPAVGPTASPASPQATVAFDALRPPLAERSAAPRAPESIPPQPTVPFSAVAAQHGLPGVGGFPVGPNQHAPVPPAAPEAPAMPSGPAPGANPYTSAIPSGPGPAFTVGAPSLHDAAGIEAALRADQARQAAERAETQAARPPQPEQPRIQHGGAPPSAFQPLAYTDLDQSTSSASLPSPSASSSPPEPAAPLQAEFVAPAPPPYAPPSAEEPFDAPFDAGQRGATAAPVELGTGTFEEQLRTAGLQASTGFAADPVAELTPLHAALLRRGLPDQIASPVTDDTLCHRVPLQPDRPARDLLASELARRIPTAPLAGRTGQAVAFVGSSGAGKTRAIARLAAAYGAAGRVPVACVTLHSAGDDGLLASALAPYGIAVHAAPDAPRALDRITALRRHALVLVDTPGVSPGDRHALDRLGATLDLLELDQVALCLPVVLAAPIARRVLRAMRPLGPTMLVATHADEADLLGGVVAVAIDRRVPLAYVSSGSGRGAIAGADANEIAGALIGPDDSTARAPSPAAASPAARAARPLPAEPAATPSPEAVDEPDARPTGPAVDVAAGAAHIAAPWIVSTPLRERRSRRK
ncbi:MAG: hypothetical protein JHD16_14030 [Solirubrobacteraceae bacterium]|nr:hypothetical protein [Solirubrobacteraceae bacterium]